LRRGLALSFVPPRDAGVARVRLLAARGSRAFATKLVALAATGRQTVHLRARNVRPGRYRIELAVGQTARSLGRPVTAVVTVTR
jgi:acetyl-CoA acetyltransferase